MSVEAEIRRRIQAGGPITFAQFMDLALYWPSGGYYAGAAPDAAVPWGPSGDYYTSPMTHPAFGALLALQLYQFWQLLGRPDPFYVVEPGAGNGLLCRDILTSAAALPAGFAPSLRYLCLDPRPVGVALERGVPGAQRLAARGMPLRGLRGCVLSNELLDAFPVHQVRQEGGQLREVYVALDEAAGPAGWVTITGEPSTPALAARLRERGITLAEGQTAEINLGLDSWAAAVAEALAAGFVLTIDYGREAGELYDPDLRPRGTLTTYYRHVQTDAPLRRVGRQDITAQVDFTSVVNAGWRAGLLSPVSYTHLTLPTKRIV